MNIKRILQVVFCLIILTNVFSTITRVFADEGTIGAYPTNYDPSNPKTKSWFIYELKPGETKEDSITVVNDGDKKTDIKIYAVDATTTSDGAFALLNDNQRQQDVGSWVHLSTSVVTVDPRSRVDVPFTISVPKYVTVGDHAGGIVIQEVNQPAAQIQGMGLNIVSRVGTRIYETVPGAKVISLDIQDIQYKIVDNHLVFTFTLVNNGNTILTPTGRLDVKDYSNKLLDSIDLTNLGSIFPGKPIAVTETSHMSAPWFGKYTVTVTVDYSPLKAIAKTVSFIIYIKDWRIALPIPIILILIGLFIFIRKVLHHTHHIHRGLQRKDVPMQNIPERMSLDDEKEGEVKKKKRLLHKIVRSKELVGVDSFETENVDALFISRHIKFLVIAVCVVIILLSCLFAFILQDFVFGHVTNTNNTKTVTIPTQSIQPTPTPLPTPTNIPVSISQIKVTVLNGSGVAGAAKHVADTLTTGGFTILNVGNASVDAIQTTIQYPNGMQDGAEQLKQVLQANYANVQEIATSDANFTIILGE